MDGSERVTDVVPWNIDEEFWTLVTEVPWLPIVENKNFMIMAGGYSGVAGVEGTLAIRYKYMYVVGSESMKRQAAFTFVDAVFLCVARFSKQLLRK
jgi:hypothetical protein